MVLNKAPAFILTQLGWTPENIDEMVKIDGNKIVVKYEGDFSSNFVLNVLASRPASVVDELSLSWPTRRTATSAMPGSTPIPPAPGRSCCASSGRRRYSTVDANPDYFNGAPKMKSVIIRHVAEAATQQLLLESGDVDMAKNLTPDQIAGLEGKGTVKIETYPQAAVHFLSFNQKTAALQPEAVWDAARYLVDYKGMTDSFLKGQMTDPPGLLAKWFPRCAGRHAVHLRC